MKFDFNSSSKSSNSFLSSGFTLIELLVVISIIGIILAFSIFGIQNAREASRDAARKSDLENVRSALELYKSDCNVYPTSPPSVGEPLLGCAGVAATYISAWPEDPTPATKQYSYSSNGVVYSLCTALENAPDPAEDASSCNLCTVGSGTANCNHVTTNP